jgi:hypothetical protein
MEPKEIAVAAEEPKLKLKNRLQTIQQTGYIQLAYVSISSPTDKIEFGRKAHLDKYY